RKKWWRLILAASLATAAACLVNPYFITGALYPLELARTMSNPIFSRYIAELTSIPDFIRRSAGWWNLSLQLHIATRVLGALSFVVPVAWLIGSRVVGSGRHRKPLLAAELTPGRAGGATSSKKRSQAKAARDKAQKGPSGRASVDPESRWRISPFRLLLY